MKKITIQSSSDSSDSVTIEQKGDFVYLGLTRLGNVIEVELSEFEANILERVLQDMVWHIRENEGKKED